jgi:hypothetical protein
MASRSLVMPVETRWGSWISALNLLEWWKRKTRGEAGSSIMPSGNKDNSHPKVSTEATLETVKCQPPPPPPISKLLKT